MYMYYNYFPNYGGTSSFLTPSGHPCSYSASYLIGAVSSLGACAEGPEEGEEEYCNK